MRRGFFLANAARIGLHGSLLKDGEGHDDGVEVGPGFADAAVRQAGDDNRTDEDKSRAQVPLADDDSAPDPDPNDMGSDGAGEPDDGDQGDGDNAGEDDADARPKKRNTAQYVREVKRELREERRARLELENRLSAIEKGDLQPGNRGGNQEATSEKPDPSDGAKYPLGVLDDGYIQDTIEWGIAQGLDARRQSEKAQAERQQAEQHAETLRSKVDELSAKGSEIFDDYEETVLEAGLRGDYQLTETTFTAAAKREHGAEILYNLANDKAEALRVSRLPVDEQVEYVLEKNREFASKRSARRKPQAGDPPSNTPRGRNSSNPIRPDTDNLDDFRKLYYGSK